jgi:carotenoid 1,2-hydratase
MTERRRSALCRSPSALAIGPSHMWWHGDGLDVVVDETTSPLPSRIKGRIRIRPTALTSESFVLHPNGRHHWWPIAPLARIEVELDNPAVRWSGAGYLDTNFGREPLENGFRRWDWCRATHERGSTLLYEVTLPDGRSDALTLIADRTGEVGTLEPTRNVELPKSPVWRVERGTRADDAEPAQVIRTLEDTPFYARSKVATRLMGQTVVAMHESLALDRFSKGIVKLMLPFRMPRRFW